ncbi:MAG: prevent-host-death family protein [Motiliproteus sp.]|jgi:prevent-host-death family protein
MQKLTANQAKTKFGDMLMRVQHAPVEIQKNGEPVAVVMSYQCYQEQEALKLEMLKVSLARADKEEREGLLVDGESFFVELESGTYD